MISTRCDWQLTQSVLRLYGNWQTTMCTVNASTNVSTRFDVCNFSARLNAVLGRQLFRPCHRLFTIHSSWFRGTATAPLTRMRREVWNHPSEIETRDFFFLWLSFHLFLLVLDVRRVPKWYLWRHWYLIHVRIDFIVYLSKTIFGLCVATVATTTQTFASMVYKEKSMFVFQRNFDVEIGRRYH